MENVEDTSSYDAGGTRDYAGMELPVNIPPEVNPQVSVFKMDPLWVFSGCHHSSLVHLQVELF